MQDTRFRAKFLRIISLGLYSIKRGNTVETTHNRQPRLSISNIEKLSDYEPIQQDQDEGYKHTKRRSEGKMIQIKKLKLINIAYFSSLETTDV